MSKFDSDIGPFGMVPAWLIHKKPGANAVLIYAAIAANWADRVSGDAWPSIATIALTVGVSENTVRVAIAALQEVGALVVTERKGEDGRSLSNRYTVIYRSGGADIEGPTGVQILKGEGSKDEDCTSIRTRITEPESERRTAQVEMFEREHQDTNQIFSDLIAEAFNNRKGTKATRERFARLIRNGATAGQLQKAILIAQEQTRDDPVKYTIGVLARFVKEGVDGGSDVERFASGSTGDARARPDTGEAQSRGLAGERPRSSTAAAREYVNDF